MLGTIITSAIALLLLILLISLDRAKDNLMAEYIRSSGRSETVRKRVSDLEAQLEQLSLGSVVDAVKQCNFEPKISDTDVYFKDSKYTTFISTDSLPLIFVIRQFEVDQTEWEMLLLRRAAHMMSDELAMAKAVFLEDEDSLSLHFLVAARDSNKASFSQNLMGYLDLLDSAQSLMHKIYQQLVEDKRNEALKQVPFLPDNSFAPKVMS